MSENGGQSWAENANATAVKMAHEILRTLIIIHGGATIAMLSFIGSVLGSGRLVVSSATMLVDPLMTFGWGIAITIGAMVAAYFTDGLVVKHTFQQEVADAAPTDKAAADHLKRIACAKLLVHVLAVILTTASVGAFVTGMYNLKDAMGAAFRPKAERQIEQAASTRTSISESSQAKDH